MKLDEELYDYYGICHRTRQDEACTEMMHNILWDDDPLHEELNQFSPFMNNDDMDLLIKFAPKLFNTFGCKDDKILIHVMTALCSHIRGFRNGTVGFKFVDKKGLKLKNQSFSVKEKALRTHATAILEILGNPSKYGDIDYLTKNYEIFMGLKKMIDNPKDFFSIEIKPRSASKTYIKKFLQELKLPCKTSIIDEFINELNN